MKPEFHSPQMSDEIVSKLPFIKKKYKYLFYPGDKASVKHVADIFSIDETSKGKIIALLKGGAMVSLKPKAKGYILPNCMYTKIQLKQICKLSARAVLNRFMTLKLIFTLKFNYAQNRLRTALYPLH